jgi:acyl-CoA thioester hydrolase
MKLELPEHKKLLCESLMPIRWGDMDAMGHLNNTVYFRYFETIRIDWFNSLRPIRQSDEEGIVIVNAFCTFHRQIEYPGSVRLKLYASGVGRSSFETWVTMERDDAPGVMFASGGATTVWVHFKEQKSRPIPEWVRTVLS